MIRHVLTSFLLLSAVVAQAAPATRAAPASRAQPNLLVQPAFQRCEQQAFVALTAAREAFERHANRNTLASTGADAATRAMLDALYVEVAKPGNHDHAAFAARRFYTCTAAARVQVTREEELATMCLARLDIGHYAWEQRRAGTAQEQALTQIKQRYSSQAARYPESLIELVVPAVYRMRGFEDDYSLREILFESCLFPEKWNAKVAAQPAPRPSTPARAPAPAHPSPHHPAQR